MRSINSNEEPKLNSVALGKLCKDRQAYRSYFNPDKYKVEKPHLKEKPLLGKNRPQIDIQTLKTIIEKSLHSAKNNRRAFHDLSANFLKNSPKEEIKSTNSQLTSKFKYSAIARFQSNKPTRFREVRPKSPIDCKQSLVVFKYNSKNRLLMQIDCQALSNKNAVCDSDEDKMDSNLDNYYLPA